MKLRIEKGKAKGEIKAPSSKSMAHRLLICAGLCQGKSSVGEIPKCDDVLATMDCLEALGANLELKGDDVTVLGSNVKEAKPRKALFCRESGSTLRFFMPIAMLSGNVTAFEGVSALMARPMAVFESLFAEKGLLYKKEDNKIIVCGPLRGGEYNIPGDVSSQFISGLLFALPLAEEDSIINITTPLESRPYLDLTVCALNEFGVNIEWADANTIKIKGNQAYKPTAVTVEGDASGAAFPDSLNLFGGNVKLTGLKEGSIQGDAVYPVLFDELEKGKPTISLADCPDLGPVLFAIATAKNGATFTDTKRLKIKESDRASAMATELQKFGAKVTASENSVIIDSGEFHAPKETLSGHNDHRIVMALSILLTATGGEIDGAEAVSKSYPEFFEHLRKLGIEVKDMGVILGEN